ncbi:MAG TPA: DUF222 domain-containing protein [Streptosporangiaceae bacterium]|nr:DUF222 domain-containing protein [Streptosporangiaceae bacterium]
MTAEPVTGHDDGEELPGSSPSPVPGTGTSGNGQGRPAQDQGGYVESGTGWPEEAGSWTGTAGPHLPGPGLARELRAAAGGTGAGLRVLTDGQLLDVIGGGRRMSSWGTWVELAAMAEYAARHPRQAGDPGPFGGGAADEVGFATRMTWTSAGNRMQLGQDFATRLPRTFAALRGGLIDMVHATVIHDATRDLSVKDALTADAELAAAAQLLTPGKLRYLAMRVILQLDPDAITRRKERAKRDANVRVFREYSGNAGITGRELPADEVLSAWQNIDDWALWLRGQGLDTSLRELQAQVAMDLLQGRDPAARLTPARRDPGPALDEDGWTGDDAPADDDAPAGGSEPADDSEPPCDGDAWTGEDETARDTGTGTDDGDAGTDDSDAGTGDGEWPQDGPEDDGQDGPSSSGDNGPRGPRGPAGPGRPGGDSGARLAAQVTILIPFETWMGWPASQLAEVPGWGPADQDTVNDLLAAAARDRASRLCVTLLGPGRTAVAHGCAPGRFTLPLAGTSQDINGDLDPPGTAGDRRQAAPDHQATEAADLIARLKIRLARIARGICGHEHFEPQYRPSRSLRHLVQARSPWCTAAGCGNHATACDTDHTIPWHKNGITCECNLSPLCRHHHRVKQLEGWYLKQPEPGVLVWHTPAGRTYTTTPETY